MATSSMIMHHVTKTKVVSNWFHEHDNEFSVLQWPSQSVDLNPVEHLWDAVEREIHSMNVQLTNLQKLRDAIMSTWNRIFEKCFQNPYHEELRLFWEQREALPSINNRVHNKVYSKCILIELGARPVATEMTRLLFNSMRSIHNSHQHLALTVVLTSFTVKMYFIMVSLHFKLHQFYLYSAFYRKMLQELYKLRLLTKNQAFWSLFGAVKMMRHENKSTFSPRLQRKHRRLQPDQW